jgi:hypothetical protein
MQGLACRGRLSRTTGRRRRHARRPRHADHAHTLYDPGVTDAAPETIEASLQFAEATTVDLGAPMGFMIASIHEKRGKYSPRGRAAAPTIDLQAEGPLNLQRLRPAASAA